MSCNITAGIAKGCNINIGGVKTIYLANGSNPAQQYQYELPKQTANLVETYNINQAGGIVGYTQTLTIKLNKMEAAKQQQIAKIAEANDMIVTVITNDNSWFKFGVERGAYLASGITNTGITYTDANHNELVIQADSKLPMEVEEFYGTVVGTWANDMRGCSHYPPLSQGGQRSLAVLTNATENVEILPAYPGGEITQIVWEGGYTYHIEAIITTAYTNNAFDAQGNSVALWYSGLSYAGYDPSYLVKVGEPTQPGIETTFKVSGLDFGTLPTVTLNGLAAYTSLDCATTSGADRIFSGPATALITITRTPV